MKGIVGTVIQFASLGTILAVLASVIHELSFYWWLSPELVDLPQAGDYLSTAARWLPTAAFGMVLGAGIVMIIPRPDGTFMFDGKNNGQTSRSRRFFGTLADAVIFGICVLLAIFGFLLLLFDPDPPAAPIAILFIVVWGLICPHILLRIPEKWLPQGILSRPAIIGLVFTPIVVVIIAAHGVRNAQAIQNTERGAHSIAFRDNDAIKNVVVVRNLAAGVLIAIPSEGLVRFFPWSGVTSLTLEVGSGRKQPRVCEWAHALSADDDPDYWWPLVSGLQRRCQPFMAS